MVKSERLDQIVKLLQEQKYVSVDTLVHQLHYSPATIRRDITQLSDLGIVKKSYGGICLNEAPKSIFLRNHEFVEEKLRIGKKAVELIEDRETVFIAGASSTYLMESFLSEKKDITVVTTDLRLAAKLHEKGIRCYCTGGQLRDSVLTGPLALQTIRGMHFHTCFFSISALSRDGVMSSPSEEFAETVKELLVHSDRAICLCLGKHIGKEQFLSLGDLSAIHTIISDEKFPSELIERYPTTKFLTAE